MCRFLSLLPVTAGVPDHEAIILFNAARRFKVATTEVFETWIIRLNSTGRTSRV